MFERVTREKLPSNQNAPHPSVTNDAEKGTENSIFSFPPLSLPPGKQCYEGKVISFIA